MNTTNTLLAAARLAYPEYEWELMNGMLFRSINPHATQKQHGEFNPLTSPADAYVLEGALQKKENGGWVFLKNEDNYGDQFIANRYEHEGVTSIIDADRAGLLLRCVETQEPTNGSQNT